jgi:diguanylate cyclase (GGDEF)-like protein
VPDRRRLTQQRPTSWWGVVGVIACLLGLSAALAARLPRALGDGSPRELLEVVGLAVMFALAEVVVLHIQVKREAQTVALSEIPLLLGLTFASPEAVVAGMTLGATTAYVIHRRQRGLKLSYNASLKLCDSLVAVTVYGAVLGAEHHFGWRWLVACFTTVVLVALLDAVTTQFVIGLHEGSVGRQAFKDLFVYPAIAVAVSTVAVVVCFACAQSATAAVPAVAAGAFLVVGYRAYSRLNDRHLSLERLYRFSQAVTGTPEVDETLEAVLGEAKELLRSEHAEITFFSGVLADTLVRVALSPSGRLLRESTRPEADEPTSPADSDSAQPVMMPRGTRDPRQRSYLARRRWREAIVVPLRGDAGVIGTLSVADRMGEVRSFHSGDMRLLETVANHAAMALQNSRLIDRLRHESLHDALTGLPNRVLLRNEATEQLAALGRHGAGVAIMIMDLDGFKEVNDTLGHQHGDELLKVVAARTVEAAGRSCTVARLGGDEFAVLVRDCPSPATAHAVALRILAALRTPTELDGVRVHVGASIGAALAPRHAGDVTGLLRFADVAMYAAKSAGGGVKIYEADADTSSPDRLAMITELREALDSGGIGIHVQPKADLRTGAIGSVEVLARWEHPRRGLLAPDDFIELVERAGLMQAFTEEVLGQALRHCAGWRAEGHEVGIAVNLSPRTLAEPTLCSVVRRLLAEHDVPAHLLTLEITEGSVMADPAEAIQALQQLRELGVRLSVDDFGVGYSSLANLSRLPVHELKIDRGFVASDADLAVNAVIIRSIVELGRNLALDVVAEGVESRQTWDWLREVGCHHAQGYWINRPMAPGAFVPWLDRWETRRAAALVPATAGAGATG